MPRAGVRVANADKWHRAIRTLVQVGIVQLLLQGYTAFAAHPLTTEQYAFVTALGTTVLSLAQNWLEDGTDLPSFGKSPPSTGANPAS